MFSVRKTVQLSAILIGAVFASNSYAMYSGSWSYGGGDSCSTCSGDGNSWSYNYDDTDDSKIVKVTAWSDTNTGKLEGKEVKHYSDGYGVDNNAESYSSRMGTTDYEKHYDGGYTIDNKTHMDSILFDYGEQCVVLDSVTMGWYNGDADVKVMAFIGEKDNLYKDSNTKYASFEDYLKDKSYDDLMGDTDNWKSYSVNDAHTGDEKTYSDGSKEYTSYFGKDKDGHDDYTASSYWLVMADGKADTSDDYFKIKHMGGHDYNGGHECKKVEIKCEPVPPNGQVPAPGSLVLLGLGLTLLGYGKRRRRSQS